MFLPFDSQNTKKLKTKSFYKQQTYSSQIVSEKAKITILFFMKNSKNNNIIFVLVFSISPIQTKERTKVTKTRSSYYLVFTN